MTNNVKSIVSLAKAKKSKERLLALHVPINSRKFLMQRKTYMIKVVPKLLVKPCCSYVDANKVDAMIKPRYNRADTMALDLHSSNAVFIDRTTDRGDSTVTTDREDSTVNAMPGARSSATVRARSSTTHLKEATTIDLL